MGIINLVFGRFNDKILCYELKRGFKGIAWKLIKLYLTNKVQSVVSQDTKTATLFDFCFRFHRTIPTS